MLPLSVADAAKRHLEVQRKISLELRELEDELQGCFGVRQGKPAFNVLSRILVIPSSEAPRAQIAIGYLKDYALLRLECQVREEWNAWQSALLNQAWLLEGGAHQSSIKLEARAFPLNYADYGGLVPGPGIKVYESSDPLQVPREINLEQGQMPGVLAIRFLDYQRDGPEFSTPKRWADEQLRLLAGLWSPLCLHLTQGASDLLRFEYETRGVLDPGFRALVVKAKVQLLERCRYNLWFCSLVWAHLASQPLPELYARFPGVI